MILVEPSRPTTSAFGGLEIDTAPGVLGPRPWTTLQSDWGAELADDAPAGPIYELFAGGGQIGLECARQARRSLVLVDQSAEACALARRNAERNSLANRTRVLCSPVEPAVFDLVDPVVILADPPYIPSSEVARHPDDPVVAIDGGADGLSQARATLRCSAHHITQGVPLLIQLRDEPQAVLLAESARPLLERLGIELREVRTHERGAVALFARQPRGTPP